MRASTAGPATMARRLSNRANRLTAKDAIIRLQLLSFVKVMELIFDVISWGRGGFSLPISGRLKSPLPMKER